MASSVNSVLYIGNGALFASQTAIQTTGNNIANVNTTGYSRQAVRLEEWPSLDYRPGQMGQGVKAAEVYRYFDKFIERSYLNTHTDEKRWETQLDQLKGLETLFNESNTPGLSAAMQDFFNAWDKLAQWPGDQPSREALLSKAQVLSDIVKGTDTSISNMIERVNNQVSEQVERANSLIQDIADLNKQISAHTNPGTNNPNSLLDMRDLKVRELSELIDIDVIDKGAGNYIINTKAGYTLVDEFVPFKLDFMGAYSNKEVMTNGVTPFDGDIQFGGVDGYEYTIKVTQAGEIATTTPPPATAAKFQVSLDGGRTWLTDNNGSPLEFTAYDSDNKVRVKDLDISFTGTNNLNVGDNFTIVPKSSVYWVEPTIGPLNISPQVYADGTENTRRITGGAIAGNLIFRDYQAEDYRDQLTSFMRTLTYEVNRLHSQGAGLSAMTVALGDYRVNRSDVPLAMENSGCLFGEKLQSGNFTFAIYDAATGKAVLPDPGIANAFTVNYDPNNTSGSPMAGSLDGIVASINASMGTYVTATVIDNRLQITANAGYNFAVADDTTGVLAALGINTFFKGENGATFELNEAVAQDRNRINAGKVNGGAEFNPGDNQNAKEMAKLNSVYLEFTRWNQKTSTQTLNGFYANMVSNIGGETAAAKFNYALQKTKAEDLATQQESISGVNLDEEMSNLIKFQASYKAAAKLITTADQMLQTLLSLKQ